MRVPASNRMCGPVAAAFVLRPLQRSPSPRSQAHYPLCRVGNTTLIFLSRPPLLPRYGRESGRTSNASKRFDQGMDTPTRKALGALNSQKLAATAAKLSPSPKAGRRSPREGVPRLTKRAAAAALHNHQVDPVSELSSWFQAGAAREEVKVLAKALASNAGVGSFLVREKSSNQNQFALMVKEKRLTLLTFLLKRVSSNGRVGYRIEGAPRSELFGTLTAFVSYYSKVQSSWLAALERQRLGIFVARGRVPGLPCAA